MKLKSVVVTRSFWRTVHDPPKRWRVSHHVTLKFVGGLTLKTTRISTQAADALVALGAKLEVKKNGQ